ncbi:unnamed protein product [Lathyrus oleraceus]
MTKIFLKTLSSFYYEHMIASAPNDFTEMVNMGMRLEEGVHEGRLSKEETSSSKKYGGSFSKRKKGKLIQCLWGGRGGLMSERVLNLVSINIKFHQ